MSETRKKRSILPLLLALTMIFLMVFPNGVFAEGDDVGGDSGEVSGSSEPAADLPAPQVTTSTAPAEPAGGEANGAETASDEPDGTEDASDESGGDEAADLGEVVAAISQAEVILVDQDGNTVPLASEQAAEVLLAPDPIGCPVGVTPLWMGGTGDGCTAVYTSIQAAIDDVSVVDGWTVYVQAGTYNENVTLNKSISLIGEDAATTIIQPAAGAGIYVRTDDTIIKNFTIDTSSWGIDFDGGSGVLPAVVQGGVDNTLIDNVILKDNTHEGIFIGNGAKVTNLEVRNSTMTNNRNGIGVSGTATSLDGLAVNNSMLNANKDHGLIIQSNAAVGAVTISNSQLNGNLKNGLIVQTGATVEHLQIENSQLNANSGVGLVVNAAAVDLINLIPATLDGNNEHGMQLFNASVGTLYSDGSIFSNSAKWEGININNSTVGKLYLYHGQISGNKGQGLATRGSTFGLIDIYNNTIQNNSQSGVALAGSISDYLWVDSNTFYGNGNGWEHLDLGYWGMALNVGGDTRIYGGNRFQGGGTWNSIWIDSASTFASTPKINYNMIDGPVWAIGNLGNKALDAEYNWWGCDGGIGSTGCRLIAGPGWGPSSNTDTDPWLTDPDGDSIWTSSDGTQGWGWDYLPPYDNCPTVYNPDQKDSDGDGIGDACDPTPFGPPTVPAPTVALTAAASAGGLIPVTGGQLVALSCEIANALALPNGNMAAFNQVMCGYQASLDIEGSGTLPLEVPEGMTFIAGMTVVALEDGTALKELDDGTLTVSFTLPEGQEGADFAILHWDAELGEWVELSPVEVADGMVSVETGLMGTFVLVTK